MQKDDRDAFSATALFDIDHMGGIHNYIVICVGFDLGIQRTHGIERN